MVDGIFNPYVARKKNFISPTNNDNPLDTEIPEKNEEYVAIRTDNYQLKIYTDETKKINKILGIAINSLVNDFYDHMTQNGIALIPLDADRKKVKNKYTLKTPSGYINVDIGNIKNTPNHDEVDCAFQRISHALYSLNKPDILKKLKISVIKRG